MTVSADNEVESTESTRSPRRSPGIRRRPGSNLMIGAVLVGTVVLAALVSYVWTPFDAFAVGASPQLLPTGANGHVLGTDQFGGDVFSMIMTGARSTLYSGVLAVGGALILGSIVGGLALIGPRWLDELLMRGADILWAFPSIVIALVIAAILGSGIVAVTSAVALFYTPIFARLCRGAGLQVMEQNYVLAARSYGRSRAYIFIRHVLPNISGILIVQATIMFAFAVLVEAALSYLGIGQAPPTPTWGGMLKDAQSYLSTDPLLAVWPGAAIALTVLGFSLLGDGLRDFLDPRLARRSL